MKVLVSISFLWHNLKMCFRRNANYRSKGGILRILYALIYSLSGFLTAIRTETAFRQEFILAAILVPTALFLPVDVVKKVLLVQSMLLVLIVELINSAIEETVNYISEHYHNLAKKIKDMVSAAVFLTIINALGLWIWVFFSDFA